MQTDVRECGKLNNQMNPGAGNENEIGSLSHESSTESLLGRLLFRGNREKLSVIHFCASKHLNVRRKNLQDVSKRLDLPFIRYFRVMLNVFFIGYSFC